MTSRFYRLSLYRLYIYEKITSKKFVKLSISYEERTYHSYKKWTSIITIPSLPDLKYKKILIEKDTKKGKKRSKNLPS